MIADQTLAIVFVFSLLVLICVAWTHRRDRAAALRRASLVPITPLPVDVAIPAKWRRSIQNNRERRGESTT